MKTEDSKFLYGKGQICQFCYFDLICCKVDRIKEYAMDKEGIDILSIQVFACDVFKFRCNHKKTIALNEEGNAGVFCVSCGKQLIKEC